jgi:ABC-2 type transport system ATP-binding protein
LRAAIWKGLRELADAGRTLLVTTQYVDEAESCDDVALIAGGRLIATGTPQALRHEALGGDIITVETDDDVDARTVGGVPGVRRIEQRGPRELWVTVADAATTLPDVVEAITAAGGSIRSATETRPSFDEVFALLVERDRRRREVEVARGPGSEPSSGEAA